MIAGDYNFWMNGRLRLMRRKKERNDVLFKGLQGRIDSAYRDGGLIHIIQVNLAFSFQFPITNAIFVICKVLKLLFQIAIGTQCDHLRLVLQRAGEQNHAGRAFPGTSEACEAYPFGLQEALHRRRLRVLR